MGWDWGGCEPLAFIPPGVTPPLPSQVGFLKILHKYEIAFLLPPSQRLGKDVCALPLPNPNLRVLSVTSGPEGKVPVSSAPPLGVLGVASAPLGGTILGARSDLRRGCVMESGSCCCPHVPSRVRARGGGTSSAPLLRGDVPDATPVPMWQGMGNLGQEQAGRRVPSAGFETSASPGHHEAEPGTPGGLLGGGSPHPCCSAPFYFPPSTIVGGPPGPLAVCSGRLVALGLL